MKSRHEVKICTMKLENVAADSTCLISFCPDRNNSLRTLLLDSPEYSPGIEKNLIFILLQSTYMHFSDLEII